MATSRDMAEFFRDESLAELQERLKIGDGLLDVIDLVENQHSAIMAWLFDPREGHGQGDSILRDFLTHVSDQAVKRWAKKLSKRSDTTQGFARNWPVQRLQTAGLGSAFAVTEFSSEVGNRLESDVCDFLGAADRSSRRAGALLALSSIRPARHWPNGTSRHRRTSRQGRAQQ